MLGGWAGCGGGWRVLALARLEVGDDLIGPGQPVRGFAQRPRRQEPSVACAARVLHDNLDIASQCKVLQAIVGNHDVDLRVGLLELAYGGRAFSMDAARDRKSVGLGTRVSVRVDLGCCRVIKKKKKKK